MKGGSAVRIKIIGSSSHGNCYVLESETGSLLIECGIQYKKIQQALNFDISSIQGCLVSHDHL
jgi:phosphoribosyl 1,2-cyclic phosphodiesterase